MAKKYTLVGCDSNVFCVLGYVTNALRETGHKDMIDEYRKEATSSNYDNAIVTSLQYLDIANEGLEDSDEDEDLYDDKEDEDEITDEY